MACGWTASQHKQGFNQLFRIAHERRHLCASTGTAAWREVATRSFIGSIAMGGERSNAQRIHMARSWELHQLRDQRCWRYLFEHVASMDFSIHRRHELHRKLSHERDAPLSVDHELGDLERAARSAPVTRLLRSNASSGGHGDQGS